MLEAANGSALHIGRILAVALPLFPKKGRDYALLS